MLIIVKLFYFNILRKFFFILRGNLALLYWIVGVLMGPGVTADQLNKTAQTSGLYLFI